jgi:hypothetical protein
MKLRKVILWLPAGILVIASIIVTLLLVTNNTKRIQNLEDSKAQPIITFTFTQDVGKNQVQSFRIICKQEPSQSEVYLCSTIPGVPRPSPTPTP